MDEEKREGGREGGKEGRTSTKGAETISVSRSDHLRPVALSRSCEGGREGGMSGEKKEGGREERLDR